MATIVTGTGGAAASGGTPAVVLGTANTAGAASTFVRDDDTILAFDATAPTNSALADAAAAGSAGVAARRDHKHGREAGGAPALTFGTANVAGTSGTPIDANSTVAVFDATAPVTQAFSDVAATGAAGTMARRDHKHGMPASPGGIGQAYQTVDNAGAALTQRSTVNFSGPGVSAADNSGASRTDVSIADPATTTVYLCDQIGNTNDWGILANVALLTASEAGLVIGHPGVRSWNNGTASSGGCVFLSPQNGAVAVIGPDDLWDITYILHLGSAAMGSTSYRFGLFQDTGGQPAYGAYFEHLAADSPVDWYAVGRHASSQTRTDMSVAVAASTWYRLRIRRIDASTIGFSINGGAETTITSNLPTGTDYLQPVMELTHAGAIPIVDLDYIHIVVSGLSR